MAHIAQRRSWQLELVIGHVQHHLRDDAQTDATFTAELASSLNLPFAQVDLNIPRGAGNLEDLARQQRYDALIGMAQQQDCSAIVTAHHGNDQLETLLMRLIRGSSLRGLGAMAWLRPITDDITLIRPMLMTDRAMAIAFLHAIGQRWREDHTNADVTRLRARLRQTVIPQLLDMRPDLPQQIVTTTEQIQAAHDLLENQCEQAVTDCRLKAAGSMHCYSRKKLKALPPILLTMVLKDILVKAGASPDRLGANVLSQFGKMMLDQDGSVRQLTLGRQVKGILDRNHLTLRIVPQEPPIAPTIRNTKDTGFEDC